MELLEAENDNLQEEEGIDMPADELAPNDEMAETIILNKVKNDNNSTVCRNNILC